MSEQETNSIEYYRETSVKVVKDMQEVTKLFMAEDKSMSDERLRALLKVYVEIQQAHLNNLSGKVSAFSREIESKHHHYAEKHLEPETGDGG